LLRSDPRDGLVAALCRAATVKRERGARPVEPQIRGCPRNCKRRASPLEPLPDQPAGRRRRRVGAASQETCRHESPISRAGRAGERTTVVATALCRVGGRAGDVREGARRVSQSIGERAAPHGVQLPLSRCPLQVGAPASAPLFLVGEAPCVCL
jgi:hypothetical protein